MSAYVRLHSLDVSLLLIIEDSASLILNSQIDFCWQDLVNSFTLFQCMEPAVHNTHVHQMKY